MFFHQFSSPPTSHGFVWTNSCSKPKALQEKRYSSVIVDEFSSFTYMSYVSKKQRGHIWWNYFIHKTYWVVSRQQVKHLRSDNDSEFKNFTLESFCVDKDIIQNLSAMRTPKQELKIATKPCSAYIQQKPNIINCSFLHESQYNQSTLLPTLHFI